jgi:2-polyprenyl-3-methyl-5-hydroxy-6-metoxy-1,4-benzoquinol methylase
MSKKHSQFSGTNNSCPVCKSNNKETFWAMRGYKLARCKKCSMVWDFFPPENELAQYGESYFVNENPKGGYANYFEGMKINKRTFSDRLKKIEKKIGRTGRFLDVGCALGDCIEEAEKLGWDAEGLEVSKYAYELAKKRGLKIKNGILKSSTYKANTFDVVAYQDVIEHIKKPIEELKIVRKILKDSGFVFLVTPDMDGIWRKILKRWWYHYKPGEHIMYFSQKSLRKALEKSGFRNIETRRTYHILSVEYVLSRMMYYFPRLFEFILKMVKNTAVKNLSFKAYTGEIEAWGQK